MNSVSFKWPLYCDTQGNVGAAGSNEKSAIELICGGTQNVNDIMTEAAMMWNSIGTDGLSSTAYSPLRVISAANCVYQYKRVSPSVGVDEYGVLLRFLIDCGRKDLALEAAKILLERARTYGEWSVGLVAEVLSWGGIRRNSPVESNMQKALELIPVECLRDYRESTGIRVEDNVIRSMLVTAKDMAGLDSHMYEIIRSRGKPLGLSVRERFMWACLDPYKRMPEMVESEFPGKRTIDTIRMKWPFSLPHEMDLDRMEYTDIVNMMYLRMKGWGSTTFAMDRTMTRRFMEAHSRAMDIGFPCDAEVDLNRWMIELSLHHPDPVSYAKRVASRGIPKGVGYNVYTGSPNRPVIKKVVDIITDATQRTSSVNVTFVPTVSSD